MGNSVEFEGYQRYRAGLAVDLMTLITEGHSAKAQTLLARTKKTIPYQLAEQLHRQPLLFEASVYGIPPDQQENGNETQQYGYYMSNEYYPGLASELYNLGGVGICVGSDQGLDFFIMANLDRVFIVDIDPNTPNVTRSYLEVGARFHKLFFHYPSVQEFLCMFEKVNWPVTHSMLKRKSNSHMFSDDHLNWLEKSNVFANGRIVRYLRSKVKYYKEKSWIGTDGTLRRTIQAYEEGRIHVCSGNITGSIIPHLAARIRDQNQEVSLIYTSNAWMSYPNSLSTLTQLPMSESAKIIFSSRVINSETATPPIDFEGMMYWTIYIFSPKDFSIWPDLHTQKNFKKIRKGIYRLIPDGQI